jgi:hypothetical protein
VDARIFIGDVGKRGSSRHYTGLAIGKERAFSFGMHVSFLATLVEKTSRLSEDTPIILGHRSPTFELPRRLEATYLMVVMAS